MVGLRLSVQTPFDGAVDAALAGYETWTAVGASAEAPLDLSDTWPIVQPQAIPVVYSPDGWDTEPLAAGTVSLELTSEDGLFSTVLLAGGTARGTYAWTLSGVERKTYRLEHLVTLSGAVDVWRTLTARFDLTQYAKAMPTTQSVLEGAFADCSQEFAFVNDETAPWELIGGVGEGIISPSGTAAQFVLTAECPMTLTFAWRQGDGQIKLLVDGVETVVTGEAGAWQTESLVVAGPGAHTVVFVSSADKAQTSLKGLSWKEASFVRDDFLDGTARVDLREGVRVVRRGEDLLPFVYSPTNFTGVAEAANGESARVSVVQLSGEGDDVSTWTETVPGTLRVLKEASDEGAVVWKGRTGVWKATFEVLGEEDALLRTEEAIFDMRRFLRGFKLIIR